jgi:uncharacterized membrane protein YkvA (DUF1232 family)
VIRPASTSSGWNGFFKTMVASARRLIEHPEQLRQIVDDAFIKMRKHSDAIREIAADLQIILRLIKAWLAGGYKDISTKSIVILIGAILYFLNPFDAIPDTIPVLGYVDDVAVVGWIVKTLKDEIEKFRVWESARANPRPTAHGSSIP